MSRNKIWPEYVIIMRIFSCRNNKTILEAFKITAKAAYTLELERLL